MLSNILQAFMQYKVLTLIFVIALVLMIVMVVLASRAVRRHNRERDKLLARFKEEERLRKAYAQLTPDLVQNADRRELLHAVALRIQKELETNADMNSAFLALPQAKRIVYALNYLLCEDCDTLSAFFRTYGQPLTGAAADGAELLFPEDARILFRESCRMFDDADETTSCTKEAVLRTDEAFAQTDKSELFSSIQKYIMQNLHEF